jgi:hypothetical protein
VSPLVQGEGSPSPCSVHTDTHMPDHATCLPPPPTPPIACVCAGIWYREWAPGAKALALVGEFNNWEPRQQDWAIKNEYGVWCLFMPDNPDGSSAIPHRWVFAGRGGYGANSCGPVLVCSIGVAPKGLGWGGVTNGYGVWCLCMP